MFGKDIETDLQEYMYHLEDALEKSDELLDRAVVIIATYHRGGTVPPELLAGFLNDYWSNLQGEEE